jgi:taurine---2-oxoglutarate transaminase
MTASMSASEIVALTKQHSFFSWSAQGAVNPIPVTRAEGVYFWDANGKRYLDFNSQVVNVNLGHGNRKVIEAIKAQADELVVVGPGMATQPRAELGQLLASLTPGTLNKFFYTLSGAEANENAVKLARGYTGRQKIITRYRSYHGATAGAMTLTGDPRRWANEPGILGVVRVFDPYKYRSPLYQPGDSDAVFARKCLDQIEEVMMYEGPQTIAAILIETITGTNGLIVPPDGYLQGLRQLCDKYGILLICDEVMAGFGRAGEWFAVNHWQVVPDLITMAKGLSSSYLPLGAVAISEKIADYYNDKVFYGGLTGHAHPLCLAAALANIQVMQAEDLVGNSRRLGVVMAGLLEDLKAEHRSVGDVRSLGLFGIVELVRNRQTKEPLAPFNGSSPEMQKVGAYLREHGLYTSIHWNNVFTCPPLCITEAELREGFEILNQALALADAGVQA